jgi:hypothetical protein
MSLLPKLNYEIDINEPLRTTEFTAVQGSDFEIVVRVKRCGTIQTLEGVTPSLIVANAAEDWVRAFTGTAGGANDESIIIPVAGTALDNNGTMNYDIKLTNTDGTTPIWRRGTFIVYPSVPTGVTPTVNNPIDWSSYGTYVDTATSGPYTAGTGIAFGTADGDGKVPIELDGVATLVSYDNTTSELTATNVQTAIDELDSIIDLHKQTITITVRNETGVQIDKGDVVYINGATGNRATVALADADIANTATKTIGLAFDDISHNSNGEIVVLGEITGVDTSDFDDGDQVWLSQTPGQPTNIRPTDDAAYAYRVGYVEVAGNNGKILVAPQFEGTVYGETFFAAASASGVRTDLDVPSNSEAVLLTPDPDTTQDVSPASGFTALRLSADGAFMALNRTAADTEAVFNFQDEGVGTWQVGLRRDPGNTPNPAPESNAFCVIDTQDASIPFWVSLVDKMVHAVTGLVSPIVKAASAAGIAFKDSNGATQATIDSTGLTATTSVVPASDNTAVLGTPSLQWLAGYISVLNAGVVHAVGASGIGFKDSTGTVQATIDSSGLALTNDLAVTEGGTGASTAQAATYNIHDTRTATMSGDETLTTTSAVYQFLDPNGSDRNLDLPNATMFVVKNTGDGGEVITVRDASDVTIDEVDNGVTLTFRWDGSAWQVMG